jgi:hypothetical protein
MGVKWMDYKGKQILYVDFRKLREEEVVETVELEAKMLAEATGQVLVLANVEGATVSSLGRIKQVGKEGIKPRIAKSALVGVSGLKEILLRAYNSFTGSTARSFATETEALEWLVR